MCAVEIPNGVTAAMAVIAFSRLWTPIGGKSFRSAILSADPPRRRTIPPFSKNTPWSRGRDELNGSFVPAKAPAILTHTASSAL